MGGEGRREVAVTGRVAEAAAGSFEQRRDAVHKTLRAEDGDGPNWRWICALFQDPDQVVVSDGSVLTRYDYRLRDDGGADLTNPVRVEETFREVPMAEAAIPGGIVEAEGDRRGRWAVRVIRGGLSRNGNFYTADALEGAAPLVEGARVLARSDEDHLRGRDTSVSALVGRIAEASYAAGGAGEIRGVLELIEPDGPIAAKLREAHAAGMIGSAAAKPILGLSIVAAGRGRSATVDGRRVNIVESIERVDSVDLVVEPSAGGAILDLIESVHERQQGDDAMRERMKRLVEARLGKARLEALDADDDEGLEALYREALAAPENPPPDGGLTESRVRSLAVGAVDDRVRLIEARAAAREAVAASALPGPAQARLRESFGRAEIGGLGADAVKRAIDAERAYLAEIAPAGQVTGLGETRVEVTEGFAEKVGKMWDAFFDPNDKSCVSVKEAYVQCTGDRKVTGRLESCDPAVVREAFRLREALSTATMGELLVDAMRKRMLADYRETAIYDGWTKWCSVATTTDFRANHRIRWGGYGDLPGVAEGGAYGPLGSPADEKEDYAVTKRGGTENITLEAIKNDDVMAVQRLPRMLSRAAKRTVSKFAADFLIDNADLQDNVALFHGTHGNLGTAALSGASLAAARLAMVKQTELTSDKKLGIGPRYLLVPFDLEEAAVNIFRRNTENDRTFVQTLSLEVIPVPEFTDANDWFVVADPMDVPTVEIGFLDAETEPQIFVQDSPSVGSLFTNDQITYKIRHIYGGAALDHRGMYKAAVT